jgi:hypothetical protein
MKAFKVTLLVVDHDELGADGIKQTVESTRYPNWCMSPKVMSVEGADIGEWDDSHALNHTTTTPAEFARLFQGEKK